MSAHRITLREGADLDGFRHAVRALVASGVAPELVSWSTRDEPGLFGPLPEGEVERRGSGDRGRGKPYPERAHPSPLPLSLREKGKISGG